MNENPTTEESKAPVAIEVESAFMGRNLGDLMTMTEALEEGEEVPTNEA